MLKSKNNKMKIYIIKKLTLMIAMGLMIMACDSGLSEINRNPNEPSEVTFDSQLLYVELSLSEPAFVQQRNLGTMGTAIQQLASLLTGRAPGDKYLADDLDNGTYYDNTYTTSVKNIVDLVDRTADNPQNVNFHNIARILKVFTFHRITDLHGDIPYFDAAKGYTDSNLMPKFDTQQSIYMDFLNELSEAVASLDESMPTYDASDIIYAGNLEQWRKLGNSLMLRIAMRMQKVDPQSAEQWSKQAINGGVFTSNMDNMIIDHQATGGTDSRNPLSVEMQTNNPEVYMSATLIDFLKSTNDPRLDIFSDPGISNNGDQKGLPNGFDANSIINYSGGNDMDTYSTISLQLIGDLGAPLIHMTYSEILLLQAEMAVRGWTNGDAQQLYADGVTAGIKQWDIFGISVPSDTAINDYLTANPFDGSLRMIGEQIWLTNFLNFHEGFASYRRTGFPVLVQVNYPGNVTGATIPRRLIYSSTDVVANTENYEEAVSRQGPDNYTTRIWWDVQ